MHADESLEIVFGLSPSETIEALDIWFYRSQRVEVGSVR